ncbi:MAG: hypothetical protein LBT75_02310 [Bacilli bacterium]|jgi:predicted outer membrane repeat protein|nr:hypothetical protein [Bacilli bacterium]
MNLKLRRKCKVMLLIMTLLVGLLAHYELKADTFYEASFDDLKTDIESLPAGSHDIYIVADIHFSNEITIPQDVEVNLKSETTRVTLLRDPYYTGPLFYITNENARLNVSNLIISGNDDGDGRAVDGEIFLVGETNNTLSLNQDSEIIDCNFIVSGGVIHNMAGTVYIKDNAKIHNNRVVDSGGVILAESELAKTYIMDDAQIYNNYANGSNSHGAAFVNKGSAYISGDVKIYYNHSSQKGGAIYNTVSDNDAPGVLEISGNVEIYDNFANEAGGAIYNSSTLTIKDDVNIHDNSANRGGAIVMDAEHGGSINISTTISGNVEIYDNYAYEDGGAIAVGLYHDDDQKENSNYELTIKDNVNIYQNTALDRGTGGAIIGFNNSIININDNVEFNDNKSIYGNGGAIALFDKNQATITDNVTLHDNYGDHGSGGAIYVGDDSSLIIQDDVELFNNSIVTVGEFGGAIMGDIDSNIEIKNNVKIYNNQAPYGGAMAIYGHTEIKNNVEITDNTASVYDGGALYIDGEANETIISGNVLFSNNKALSQSGINYDGGAIYINSDVKKAVEIKDTVRFLDNEAAGNGGAIFTDYYEMLMVDKDVIFSNNKAGVGYNDDVSTDNPAIYAIYETNIKVPNTKWSDGRTYGYNNYDINYQGANEAFLVKYDAGLGNGPVPASKAHPATSNVNVDFSVIPTLKDHKFIGWSTHPIHVEGDKPEYPINGNANSFEMPNEDITLYAMYGHAFLIETEVVGGTIDASAYVLDGENHTVNFKANKNYHLSKVIVDGKEIMLRGLQGEKYEFTNVLASHKIKVIYELNKDNNNDNNNNNDSNNKEINNNKKNKVPNGGNDYLSYLGLLASMMAILGTGIYYQKIKE